MVDIPVLKFVYIGRYMGKSTQQAQTHAERRGSGGPTVAIMADNQLLNDNDDGVVGGDDDIFVYTGGDQEVPRDVKRVRIAENVDTIPERTFQHCAQLIEVVGHNRLRKIEQYAFHDCPCLSNVSKMTGLIEMEAGAFYHCYRLSELEFDRLEIIGYYAIFYCNSLRSIKMPSIRRVGGYAFAKCYALRDVVFGEKLERIERNAFDECTALRRITIPLKDNLIIGNSAFSNCGKLSNVDTIDGGIHKTVSSLHMKMWRDEMEDEIDEIDRINQTLPTNNHNEKSQAIQQWITRVFSRMEHFKSEHQLLLKEVTTLLELALWKANLHENEDDDADAQEGVRVTRGQRKRKRKDRCITSGASIVIKNVLPFLALN